MFFHETITIFALLGQILVKFLDWIGPKKIGKFLHLRDRLKISALVFCSP